MEKDEILSQTKKEKIVKEYYRRLWLILKSKLNDRNKVMGINMWVVAVHDSVWWRYCGLETRRTEENAQEDQEDHDHVWCIDRT